jgi:hypothetical protein
MRTYRADNYDDGIYIILCKSFEVLGSGEVEVDNALLYNILQGYKVVGVENKERGANITKRHSTQADMIDLVECYTTKVEREDLDNLVGSVGFAIILDGTLLYTNKTEILELVGYEEDRFSLTTVHTWDKLIHDALTNIELEN